MHYRIEHPEDPAAASILDTVLASLLTDPAMKEDLQRLKHATCEPQQFVTLQGAPAPSSLHKR